MWKANFSHDLLPSWIINGGKKHTLNCSACWLRRNKKMQPWNWAFGELVLSTHKIQNPTDTLEKMSYTVQLSSVPFPTISPSIVHFFDFWTLQHCHDRWEKESVKKYCVKGRFKDSWKWGEGKKKKEYLSFLDFDGDLHLFLVQILLDLLFRIPRIFGSR